jgi:phasin family protein
MAQNPRQTEREGTQIAEEATRKTAEHVTQAARTMADTGERTARAGAEAVRHQSEAVRDAWQSGTSIATQITDRSIHWMSRALGLCGNGAQDTIQQSSRNLNVILETSTALAAGMQSVSREWMSFAQKRAEQNLDKLDTLLQCRTPHELIAAQTDIVRDNLEDLLESSRRISEMATRMAEEATRKMSETSLAPR